MYIDVNSYHRTFFPVDVEIVDIVDIRRYTSILVDICRISTNVDVYRQTVYIDQYRHYIDTYRRLRCRHQPKTVDISFFFMIRLDLKNYNEF